jgi:glycosyltransferase involved in cell wall biosynthesis
MRVALFNDACDWGGAERYFEDLCTAFVARDMQLSVALATCQEDGRQRERLAPVVDDLTFIPSGVRPASVAIAGFRSAWAFLRQRQIDVAHFSLHHADSCRYWIEAARFARVPYVISEHLVSGDYLHASRLTHIFKSRSYRTAKRVIVVSPTAATALLAEGAAAKMEVIPNGVRTQEGQSRKVDGPVRVLFLGRLSEQKNPLAAVAAFADVARVSPGARLRVCGDGPLRRSVEEDIVARGLSDIVDVVGFVDDSENEFAYADVLLVSSNDENSPYVVLEAMAAGCAVVSTDVGGVSGVLGEGEAGVIVAGGDVDALASGLASVVTQPQLREKLGKAARARVNAEYSLDRMVNQTIDTYELARRPHSRLS